MCVLAVPGVPPATDNPVPRGRCRSGSSLTGTPFFRGLTTGVTALLGLAVPHVHFSPRCTGGVSGRQAAGAGCRDPLGLVPVIPHPAGAKVAERDGGIGSHAHSVQRGSPAAAPLRLRVGCLKGHAARGGRGGTCHATNRPNGSSGVYRCQTPFWRFWQVVTTCDTKHLWSPIFRVCVT